MAKILCNKSGIQFNVEHFPISFTQNECHHPIFDASLKKLWKYYPKWQSGELDSIDSYLLFLSLLNATDLVQFRVAAQRTEHTESIISQNMESLYDTIGRIAAIRNPRFVLPRFVVSNDTKNLSNVKHWIQLWQDAYTDFCNGLKDQDLRTKLQKRESALERLIRNPAIKPERYSHLLAQWAAMAGQFPEFNVFVNGSNISVSEYWQSIIQSCYKHIDIIQIPRKDIAELIEHCEDTIELGSIFSYQLFTTLREGIETIDGFFNIGNNTTFSILQDNDSVESSNLQLLINDAPPEEPKRKDYPTEFAFLKARMKWSLAVSFASQSSSAPTESI
jgi:hypothetical protein